MATGRAPGLERWDEILLVRPAPAPSETVDVTIASNGRPVSNENLLLRLTRVHTSCT